MKTKLTDMFGLQLPIFAFTHCRDVVAAVTNAGGMGVLGCAYQTPGQLEEELNWIDAHVDGKPYGIDLMMPGKYQSTEAKTLGLGDLPREQTEYMRKICDDAGIPRLPEDTAEVLILAELAKLSLTPQQASELLEVGMRHPIRVVVSALGTPPREMVDMLHGRDIKVGALIGKLEHAHRQRDAGVDMIVAQGYEAGGHSGTIASMILWPQVVDAMGDLPVVAAGGIGGGRQMAAAIALGAEGIWCGSIWLGTTESEVLPETKDRLFEARAEDAIQSRARTGKPVRMLRSLLTEAWEKPGAPPFLPMPLQTAVMIESRLRVERARAREFLTYPVGQIVGEMRQETSCRQIIFQMLDEFVDAMQRINTVAEG